MDDRISAIILGVLFSVLNAIVTVYLVMKTGMMDGIILLLLFLSAFIFMLTRSVKPRAFIYILAIITSSMDAVIAYTDGLGAIIISGEPFLVPDYVIMVLLAIAGIIGILMSFYFMDYFLNGSFPWPMSRVNASIITLLSAEKKNIQFKISGMRMGISGIFSGVVAFLRGLGFIPDTIGSTVAGISISPMMIGIGMVVGFKACVQIAIGAIVSLAILLFLEGINTDYTLHMRSPWIFSTAISILVTTAFITLYSILKPSHIKLPDILRKSPRGIKMFARDGGKDIHQRFNVKTIALLACIVVAAVILQLFVSVPVWVFLICIPIVILFQVIETRGRAEVAGSVGVASFIIILIVGIAFRDIVPLLILEGFVVAMVMSFPLTLSIFKTAEYSNVTSKGLLQMLVIGSILGSVICIPIIRFLNSVYGIGSDALPAPYSVMWLEMARSAVSGVISPSINFYLIVAGIIIALVLHRYKISAVCMALGMILPFSIIATLFVGGIIEWYIEKKGYLKDDNGITASGLIAGDILVGLAMSVRAIL